MSIFRIVVNNTHSKSHNINISKPTYYSEASNKYEAVGKMVLSEWSYKHLPIYKIEETK